MWHYLKACNPCPKTETQFLFNHIRDFEGYLIEAITNNVKDSNEAYMKVEEAITISQNCTLTTKQIKHPGLIKLDDGRTVLIDRS